MTEEGALMNSLAKVNYSYNEFANVLSDAINREALSRLLNALCREPRRFTGVFRPLHSRRKLLLYLLQSKEICFGDAIEAVFESILTVSGYTGLEKQLRFTDETGKQKELECDLFLRSGTSEALVFIEQKMRDDHDSSKKRGQWNNFEQKIRVIREQYRNVPLYAVMHFVDPSFDKNMSFYKEKAEAINDPANKITVKLLYGGELFQYLGEEKNLGPVVIEWSDIERWLHQWRESLPEDEYLVNWDDPRVVGQLVDLVSSDKTARGRLIRLCEAKEEDLRSLWSEGLMRVLSPEGQGLTQVAWSLIEKGEKEKSRSMKVGGMRLYKAVRERYNQEHRVN
jgi:hypothetical protein